MQTRKTVSARKIPGQKQKKGGFSVITRNGYLYISLPTTLGYKRGSMVSLDIEDTSENRVHALSISQTMYDDVRNGKFVDDINQYLRREGKGKKVRVNSNLIGMTIQDAWVLYLEKMKPVRKVTTIKYLENTLKPHLVQFGSIPIFDAQKVYNTISTVSTPKNRVRVLRILSRVLATISPLPSVQDNPYDEVIELATGLIPKEICGNEAKAITEDQFNLVCDEMSVKHPQYANFIKFIYLTGCRPSEAVGLRWDSIEEHHVILGHSLTKYEGKWEQIQGSKNNRLRKFPITEPLRNLLNELPKMDNEYNLVFLSPKGKPITLSNFYNYILKPLNPGFTLYNLRDTFITRQVDEGIPLAVIGRWCDNTERVIQAKYLDTSQQHSPV